MFHLARRRPALPALAVLLAVCFAAARPASAEPPQPLPTTGGAKFLRYVDDAENPRLETSVVTYRRADGVTVDLIGAVHIGDREYYDALDERFKAYDAVLYEMVKPKQAGAPKPGHRSNHWVGTVQRFMQEGLGLTFQLDEVDYAPKNFVHADLDAETFQQRQAERGESMLTLMFESMLKEMNNPSAAAADQVTGIMDLVNALQAPDRERQLKLVLAKQFGEMDRALSAMDDSVLLGERNTHALKVLREQVDGGKRKLAIFYGAGHLKGMEELLVDLMGFQQVGEPQYLTAWDLRSTAQLRKAARTNAAPTTRPAN